MLNNRAASKIVAHEWPLQGIFYDGEFMAGSFVRGNLCTPVHWSYYSYDDCRVFEATFGYLHHMQCYIMIANLESFKVMFTCRL